MTSTLKQVTNFITALQEKYPQLKIEYDYDSGEDYYYINRAFVLIFVPPTPSQ